MIGRLLKALQLNFYFDYRVDIPELYSPSVDFKLVDYPIVIAYYTQIHYKPVKQWGGERKLAQMQYEDSLRTRWCADNNHRLIIVRYDDPNPRDYLEKALSSLIADTAA